MMLLQRRGGEKEWGESTVLWRKVSLTESIVTDLAT